MRRDRALFGWASAKSAGLPDTDQSQGRGHYMWGG